MPTYDYHCDACSHEFEQYQSIKDAPLKKCPECGKNKLRRLIGGGAAIVFKGSGFYQTDYRSDSYKKGLSESKKSSESASGTASATNSAPAATGTASTGKTATSATPSSTNTSKT